MCVPHSISEDEQERSLEQDESWEFVVDEDGEYVIDKLDEAIFSDNKKELISVVQRHKSLFHQKGQAIIDRAFGFDALECALALIKGETPLIVDVNCRTPGGTFLIHTGAAYCDPAMIEFLLHYGARADVRCDVGLLLRDPRPGPQLPLYLVLTKMSRDVILKDWSHWTYQDSIFKLLTSVCLPLFQRRLEAAGLLVWNMKDEDIENEILQCSRGGQLAKIAALLVVAHKKLGVEKGLRLLSSLNRDVTIPDDKKEGISLLFEVIFRAGDAIEAYVKQEKFDVTVQQTSKAVAGLLQKAGFALKLSDTDLTCSTWFRRGDHIYNKGYIHAPKDCAMPHYGKSGLRWMTYDKPNGPSRMAVIDQQKVGDKYDEQFSMEERLKQALIDDDKEEFILTIHKAKRLFQLKGQEIFEKACEFRAIECAKALLMQETPLFICINGRTPDRMFPIHHAARTCHPSITELALNHGARADARADVNCVCRPPNFVYLPRPKYKQRLPLYLTLYMMRIEDAFSFLPRLSIFQLLTAICLPRFRSILETVDLLAWKTTDKEIGQEFLQCAIDAELPHMAALLLVAHKKLSDPIETILKSLSSGDYAMLREDDKEKISLLLNAFMRAGDTIERSLKQEKMVTVQQTSEGVARFLQEAGFNLKPGDTDLTRYSWARADKGNYGKSSYRWVTYGKSSNSYQVLGKRISRQPKLGEQCLHSLARENEEAKMKAGGVVLCWTSGFSSQTPVVAKHMRKLMGEVASLGALWRFRSIKPRTLLAYGRRGYAERVIIKLECYSRCFGR